MTSLSLRGSYLAKLPWWTTRFISGKKFNSNQIEFANMIVNHLTEHGVMDAALLYESPFTDITPQDPDGLFTPSWVDELVSLLEEVYARAIA
nr:type I restriction-modification enzyme R subunit C-terminal domain-containing protein [Nostoc sp. FACHB-892]